MLASLAAGAVFTELQSEAVNGSFDVVNGQVRPELMQARMLQSTGMPDQVASPGADERHSARPVPRFLDSQASVLLDLLRGLAAVCVLMEHWRNILFVDYRDVATHRVLWAPAYIACSCGIASVMLFFVLSGYLVGGSALRMFRQGTWSWREYLLHRFTRLWIVLIPALLLCALLDTIGLKLPFASLLYHGLSGDHVVLDVAALRTPPIFLGNLFFLQTIQLPLSGFLVPTFGSAGSLWSLANEFWYYLLFPLCVLVLRRDTQMAARLAYAALLGLVCWFIGWEMCKLFLVWLLGALLAVARPLRVGVGVRWTASLLYLLPFLSFKRWTIGVTLSNLTLGVFTALLLWTMLSANSAAAGRLWERFARRLSSFSFTLYLVHIPLCTLLAAWFVRDHRFQPGLRALPVALGIFAVALLTAFLLASVTEYRTNQTRLWIQRHLFKVA